MDGDRFRPVTALLSIASDKLHHSIYIRAVQTSSTSGDIESSQMINFNGNPLLVGEGVELQKEWQLLQHFPNCLVVGREK